MKHSSKTLLILLSLLFYFHQLQATKNSGFSMPLSKKKVIIPFKFVNKSILIPLTINNSDTLHFILDSGLSTTLITELFAEDSLHLNNVGEKFVQGLGGDESIEVIVSVNNKINLNGIVGTNQKINLIKEDIFNLSQLSGQKINGIIGYDFFKDLIVKINYKRQELTVYNPAHYTKKWRRYLHFPIEIIHRKPYLKTGIIAPNGHKIMLKLMVDTGASLALWLIDSQHIQIPKPNRTIPSYLGQGLSGKIYGDFGRIPSLLFKDKSLLNVLTAFPYREDVEEALTEGRNGSIGSDVLRRFHVIIDYPNNRISLKPNAFFKEPFEYNLSGIEIHTPNPRLPYYKIYTLSNDSPAKKSGLKTGDAIIKINGRNTAGMKFEEVIRALDKKKKKGVSLLIDRDGSMIEFKYIIPKENPI